MTPATTHILWHRLKAWWKMHRPLAWLDAGLDCFDTWRPDPPVMERLIR